jgi:hypothetical protein
MLPVVWAADDPGAVLEAYNALYLHEEVQQESLVRNIGAFARFLQAMSLSHASVLNLANVSREAQASRKTVEGYLQILEDLLLGFRLEVFTRRARRELAAHPKFYSTSSIPVFFARTDPQDLSTQPPRSKALPSKVWSRSICTPGATTHTVSTRCITGRLDPVTKSISCYTASQGSTLSK